MPSSERTAAAGSFIGIEAMNAGARDYLSKPFRMEELLARLREADRKRRLGAEADQPHRIKYKPLVRA